MESTTVPTDLSASISPSNPGQDLDTKLQQIELTNADIFPSLYRCRPPMSFCACQDLVLRFRTRHRKEWMRVDDGNRHWQIAFCTRVRRAFVQLE